VLFVLGVILVLGGLGLAMTSGSKANHAV
jgi:hypothetical protein